MPLLEVQLKAVSGALNFPFLLKYHLLGRMCPGQNNHFDQEQSIMFNITQYNEVLTYAWEQ